MTSTIRKRLLVSVPVIILAIIVIIVVFSGHRPHPVHAKLTKPLSPAQTVATTKIDHVVGSTMQQIEAAAKDPSLSVDQKKSIVKRLQAEELAQIVRSARTADGARASGAATKSTP